MRIHTGFRLQLLAGVALATAAPAFAQTAPDDTSAPATTSGADAAVPAGDNRAQIQEIVVTATKRETNLQRTPISMSVLSSVTLEDRHVQSLYDLADGAVPSLRVATFEARQSALTIGIRGIVPLDANQPAREQGVGIYIDGVYLGRQHGLNAALFDVERVEVLKGPQGTLFGRNTEGGALSIVSKGPSGQFGGRITGGVANLGGYNADAHIDLPSLGDFSFKIDGVIQYQGPATKNPLSGQTGWGYFDRKGGRVAVRWKPNDSITNDFAFDRGVDKNSPFYSQLLNYNPNNCVAGPQAARPNCFLPGTSYTTLTGTVRPLPSSVVVNGRTRMRVADIGVPQQPSVDKTHGFTNTFKFKASPEIELRSITAWRGVNVSQWDNAGGAHRPPVVAAGCTGTACNFSRYSIATLTQDQFSQELQAVGTIGKLDYVAGLYYFNERVSDDAATPNSNAWNSTLTAYTILDPCTGSGGFGWQFGCRSVDRASRVKSQSYAAYGQATWNPTETIHLTVGGRYTKDKKRGALIISRNLSYGNATPEQIAATGSNRNIPTATAAQLAAAGYTPLDKTWNRFNPMATLAFDASDNLHLYAKYATGYRAGGASSRTSNYQAFGPEDVDSYEIGLKSDLFDRRVRFNIAGYIMERKNSQVDISSIQFTSTGNFNNLVTINAPGKTKIRGIEADVTIRPVAGLTLTAAYAYTYTRIPLIPITNSITTVTGGVTTTTTAAPVLQRFYIPFTPRNAASGSLDYSLPVGGADTQIRFHADANYAQATQAFDQFATKAESSFIVNARLSLADISMGSGGQKLTLSVWGRNVFDQQYIYRRDPSNSLPAAPSSSLTSGNIGNTLGDYGNFNAPRTYGIEASVRF